MSRWRTWWRNLCEALDRVAYVQSGAAASDALFAYLRMQDELNRQRTAELLDKNINDIYHMRHDPFTRN